MTAIVMPPSWRLMKQRAVKQLAAPSSRNDRNVVGCMFRRFLAVQPVADAEEKPSAAGYDKARAQPDADLPPRLDGNKAGKRLSKSLKLPRGLSASAPERGFTPLYNPIAPHRSPASRA